MSADKQKYLLDYLREHGPVPLRLVAAATGVSRVAIRERLLVLERKGLAHVARYEGVAPYWAAGSGPKARMWTCRQAVLEELEAGPRTCKSISASTGYCHQQVMREVAAMHTDGVLHVAEWHRESQRGPWVRVYALGEIKAKDAARPKRVTAVERCADYRARPGRLPGWAEMLMK